MYFDNPEFSLAAKQIKFLGIDFDGVMTDNRVYVFEDGREAVMCSRLEGFGLQRLVRQGVQVMIISTEKNPVVSHRAKKLNIECIQSVDDKTETMSAILSDRGLSWANAGFIGNDINDLGPLERVGLPIIVADAHESLNDIRAYRTKRVGGHGAVREACDAIAAVREAS